MESNITLNIFNNRYIENKYFEKDLSAMIIYELSQVLELELENLISDQILNSPLDQNFVVNSSGKVTYSNSIYLGTGSNMYVFWRYYLFVKGLYDETEKGKSKNALNYFKLTVETNLSNINKGGMSECCSFFMSNIGVYTLSCIYYRIVKDKSNFEKYLNEIFKYSEMSLDDEQENELLYGNTGYLYALLLILNHTSDYINNQDKIRILILRLIQNILSVGINFQFKFNSKYLVWPWPKNENRKVYLGAAHGVVGVLYIILRSFQILNIKVENASEILEIPDVIDIIKNSLNELLRIRFQSGNFPVSPINKDDKIMHFCHGSPGAIPLFILASQFFKNDEYLEAAIFSGEDLWVRGLLLKGNSICHGIVGNAYILHSLYVATTDIKWKNRAFLYASAIFDKDIQSICSNFKDPMRKIKGVPDYPYSLMEGKGGVITLISDLLGKTDLVKFPGYEI